MAVASKAAKATPAGRATAVAKKAAPAAKTAAPKKKTGPAAAPTRGRATKGAGGPAANRAPRATAPAPSRGGGTGTGRGTGSPTGRRAGRSARRFAAGRKLLLGEFFGCMLLLILGAMAEDDPSHAGSRTAVKGTALAAVFVVLALVSSGGDGARKVANALGGLVFLAYLVNEAKLIDTVTGWITSKKVTDAVG